MARSQGKKGSGIVWRVVVQGETVGNAGALRDRSEVRLAAVHFSRVRCPVGVGARRSASFPSGTLAVHRARCEEGVTP